MSISAQHGISSNLCGGHGSPLTAYIYIYVCTNCHAALDARACMCQICDVTS